MKIIFKHSHCYDWESIAESEAQEGDILGTNAKGSITRRISIESPNTECVFRNEAIAQTQKDREKANAPKWSDFQIITFQLSNGVMPHHFDLDHLTDITVEGYGDEDADLKLANKLKDFYDIETK